MSKQTTLECGCVIEEIRIGVGKYVEQCEPCKTETIMKIETSIARDNEIIRNNQDIDWKNLSLLERQKRLDELRKNGS